MNENRKAVGDGDGVGLEEGIVDFGENGVDGLGFGGKLHGEVAFELIDELRDDVRL